MFARLRFRLPGPERSMPEALPQIPTPPAQLWREFRVRYLPGFVFACAVILIIWFWSNYLLVQKP
jgi:heme A synthase